MVAAGERDEEASPEAIRLSVREAARLARTASPSAPPIMNDVLTTPEASPASIRLDVAHRGEQHRVERHAGAEAEQDHAGGRRSTKFPSTGARAKSTSPSGTARARRASGGLMPKRMTSLGREQSENAPHDQVGRQERETDLERAVAEHELEVERREEEPREHRRRPRTPTPFAVDDVPQPEEAERDERRSDARLDHEEDRHQRSRAPSSPSVWADVQPCWFRSRSRRPRASARPSR